MDRQYELLHPVGLVALEARSGWNGGLDDPFLNDNARPDLATAWARFPCMPDRDGSPVWLLDRFAPCWRWLAHLRSAASRRLGLLTGRDHPRPAPLPDVGDLAGASE